MDARISSSGGGGSHNATTGASSQAPPAGIASKSYTLSGKIMLSSIVSLLAVVLFILCLHIYSRWYFLRLARRRRRARAFTRRNAATTGPGGGLDPELIKSLPVFTYSAEQRKEGEEDAPPPECAVCLCEFERRDQGRVLPACAHVFHAECIDMWFQSHSTCPLCRAPVERAAGKLQPAAAAVAAVACRCGEAGEKARTPASCSASTSSSGSASPGSSSVSPMTRCFADLDFRTSGVTEGRLDRDLERGEAVTETTPSTANRTSSSKTRTSS